MTVHVTSGVTSGVTAGVPARVTASVAHLDRRARSCATIEREMDSRVQAAERQGRARVALFERGGGRARWRRVAAQDAVFDVIQGKSQSSHPAVVRERAKMCWLGWIWGVDLGRGLGGARREARDWHWGARLRRLHDGYMTVTLGARLRRVSHSATSLPRLAGPTHL